MCRNSRRLVVLIQFLVLIQASSQYVPNVNDSTLLTVSMIFRHGDRSPYKTYPNDPYRDPKYWPMGYGQLTNTGKMQEFQLGQYIRNRYSNFLSPNYNVTELYVRSTDKDCTLMSAESNLAGLYPPMPEETWNPTLPWQPIPVHTTEIMEDSVLAMVKPCEKYEQLYQALLNTDEFVNISRENHDLYDYLTKNSGQLVKDLPSLQTLYDVLFVEDLHNLTLPEWTKPVFPDEMKEWSDFNFAVATYTDELAQLKTGPFLNELASHFENFTSQDTKKLYMYSGHDITIADVLNSLGLFEYHSPPYAATVFFELRAQNNSYFVNILYKNTSEPQRMVLKDCDFNCPLDQFLNILAPLRLNHEDWEYACQLKFLGVIPYNTLQNGILIGCIVLLFILLCVFVIAFICARRRRKAEVDYLQLPGEELH